MQVSKQAEEAQKSPIGHDIRVSDEQKWQDIAEGEFEVSSSHSPMKNYTPEFLKQLN